MNAKGIARGEIYFLERRMNAPVACTVGTVIVKEVREMDFTAITTGGVEYQIPFDRAILKVSTATAATTRELRQFLRNA
jgi:hypothetical protein